MRILKFNIAVIVLAVGWASTMFCLVLWSVAMSQGGEVLFLPNEYYEGWVGIGVLASVSVLHPWALWCLIRS